EQSILLVDTHGADASWQSPTPADPGAFDWDNDGPFATMKAARITSQLAGLVADGYLDQDVLDRIDVDFVVPGQPCFMARPALCHAPGSRDAPSSARGFPRARAERRGGIRPRPCAQGQE